MKTWTESAEQRLTDYLNQRPKEWGLEGEAAEEMASDLRSHVHEELQRDGVEIVTAEALERVLIRMGGRPSEIPAGASAPQQPKAKPQPPRGCMASFTGFMVVLFALIAPLGAVLFESLGKLCAGVLFAALPTGWHLLMVALVVSIAVITVQGWIGYRWRQGPRWNYLIGFSFVISAYYALLFLPVTPAAVPGIIFGVGILALAPLGCALWFSHYWRGLKRRAEAAQIGSGIGVRRQLRIGALVGLGCLLLGEAPAYLTRFGLAWANSPNAEKSWDGVQFLRKWGSEECLHKICMENPTRPCDAAGWVEKWLHGFTTWDPDFERRTARTREVHYLVTGQAFNTPSLNSNWFDGRSTQDLNRDTNRGGDTVAGAVEGLSLTESRIDGHLDQASQLAYQEWTFVFSNDAREPGEARFQAQLPPQGVVSRLTLWANDEPREAAFSSVANVKAAYKDVVVVKRRDPVMVNVCGPDRIFVQCFPVPALGGKMKIRLGITSPLVNGSVQTPYLLERNYAIGRKVEQQVWMQGNAPFRSLDPDLASNDAKGTQALTSNLPHAALTAPTTFTMSGPPGDSVWTEDPFAPEPERILSRTWEKVNAPPLGKPIFVLDGSISMRSQLKELKPALGAREVILAGDTVRHLKADQLQESDFVGGCDNAFALVEGLMQAQRTPGSVIVWLHGPQPVMLGSKEKLLQLVEKGRAPAQIYDVPMVVGVNRISETLTTYQILQTGPPRSGLGAWLAALEKPSERLTAKYTRSATAPAAGTKVWDQLARYAAYEQLRAQSLTTELMPEATALAAKYQLVTPWSGAVVLENKAQYDQHGLTPVDPKAVPEIPVVPEPSTMALLAPGVWFALRRRRRS